jgi:general secretion pathway protein K
MATPMMSHPAPSLVRQRGAALLMAMMIVALVSTMAAAMVWQQWRAVQVEAAERARTQSDWILIGALDWARLILREDARSNRSERVDHLGEPWAVPLAEARLSTFLAADKNNTSDEEGPDAFLSGSITDAQSRYNLRNLLNGDNATNLEELAVLKRLLEAIDVSPELATVISKGMRESSTAPPVATAPPPPGSTPTAPPPPPNPNPLPEPHSLGQLAWFGIDAETIKRLEPYLVILPKRTTVNINTASREVLSAVIDGVDLGSAERLTQNRQRAPFKKLEDIKQYLPPASVPQAKRIGVASEFFEIRGRLRLEDKVLEERTLVRRNADLSVEQIFRERVNNPATP